MWKSFQSEKKTGKNFVSRKCVSDKFFLTQRKKDLLHRQLQTKKIYAKTHRTERDFFFVKRSATGFFFKSKNEVEFHISLGTINLCFSHRNLTKNDQDNFLAHFASVDLICHTLNLKITILLECDLFIGYGQLVK